MIYIVIACLLAILAGLSKGMRDTIKHHWEKSIFRDIDRKDSNWLLLVHFYYVFTCRFFMRVDDYEKKLVLVKIWLESKKGSMNKKNPFLFMFHDGWHFFDEVHIIATFLSGICIVLAGITWINYLLLFGLLALSFNLSYHGVFLRKEYRTWFWFRKK